MLSYARQSLFDGNPFGIGRMPAVCVSKTEKNMRPRARQQDGRLPKRLAFGTLAGGEDPGPGCPEQNWLKCLRDDFQAFGATDGSTDDKRLMFGVESALWPFAAKKEGGIPWHAGVLQGAERFMTSWHSTEEASRLRALKREFRGE